LSDRIVVDASVIVALLLREPQEHAIRTAMGRWWVNGVELLVPDHFWLEFLSTTLKSKRWHGANVIAALREIDLLELTTVAMSRALLLLASDMMERHGLTAYDAAYLAVARSSDATLATLDTDLRRAARDILEPGIGVDPAPPGHSLSEPAAPYGDDTSVAWHRWPGAGSYLGTLRRRALAELETGGT
jgi:predicted nucleic acid-binding protein